jgi:lysophospholipase L1-like esterase
MSNLNELLSIMISKLNTSVRTEAQNLTEEQKAQVRKNIGVTNTSGNPDNPSAPAEAVLCIEQYLTEEQKAQARENIGAVDEETIESIVNKAIVKTDLEEYEPLGQSPQYIDGADNLYNIVVDAKEETLVCIDSDTVADLSTVTNISFQGASETYKDGVYTLTCTAGGQWFQHRKYFNVGGLTTGEKYVLMLDVTDVEKTNANTSSGYYAHVSIHDAEDPNLANILSESIHKSGDIKGYEFTAPSGTVRVYLNAAVSDIKEFEGVQIQYRDIWVNRKDAKELRTAIYKKELTTSEMLVLKDIRGGVTIETTPPADIYLQLLKEEQPILSVLSGKICVCFGDSITGNYAKFFDYPSVIAEKTGMTVVNGGFGGCRMAKHPTNTYDAYSMYHLADSVVTGDWSIQDAVADAGTPLHAVEHITELKALDWNKVDIVTILFGANDFTGGVELEDESNPLSINHYKGAARYSIEKLLTAYPNLRIILMSPLYHYKRVDDTIVDTDTYTSNGKKMSEFVDALKEVAEEYKLPFFDMYNTLGINKLNREVMLPDGAHPSQKGINRIGESIAARLSSI